MQNVIKQSQLVMQIYHVCGRTWYLFCLDRLWHHDRCTQTLLDTVRKPSCFSHQLGRFHILTNCSFFHTSMIHLRGLACTYFLLYIMTSSGPTHAPRVGSRRDLNLVESLDAVGGQFNAVYFDAGGLI
jgi:hypothetical protein